MNRRDVFGQFVTVALGFAMLPCGAIAQQQPLKQQLVGTWMLVSADNVGSDGIRRQSFGAAPRGIMILDASGRYAEMIVRAERPKFASNNRLQGTSEENKAVIAGTVAAFGTWSVNETERTIEMRIEGSLFPNQDGTDGKRLILSLTADGLKIANPGAGASGRAEAQYKRVE
jgi:hypothetical protein